MQSANSYQQSVAREAVKRLKLKPPPLVKMENGVAVVPEGFTEIPGHEGRYSIDEDGRVFSIFKGRLLSIQATNTGYLAVGIMTPRRRNADKTLIQYLMIKTFMPDFPKGAWVDHENRCRSDNRIENLRPANRRENVINKTHVKQQNNTKYRGVILKKNYKGKPWVATARMQGSKKKWSRYCATDREAALEYDKMAIEYHGEFAVTNKSLGLL